MVVWASNGWSGLICSQADNGAPVLYVHPTLVRYKMVATGTRRVRMLLLTINECDDLGGGGWGFIEGWGPAVPTDVSEMSHGCGLMINDR